MKCMMMIRFLDKLSWVLGGSIMILGMCDSELYHCTAGFGETNAALKLVDGLQGSSPTLVRFVPCLLRYV